MPPPKPLILFIDAYDSFSNNIISLLETELDVSVHSVKIDCPALSGPNNVLLAELSQYAAVVCGPGPGHPGRQEDVGIMTSIWKLGEEDLLPVLGICLGFQSLCLEFGAQVKRLKGPQHGMTRRVTHVGECVKKATVDASIFEGVGEVKATLYHSLCVDIGQDRMEEDAYRLNKWKPTTDCPQIIPLAWVESNGVDASSGIWDNRVLVAARHTTKPFWALQYHPESICTNDESKRIINKWFEQASEWNRKSRQRPIAPETLKHGQPVIRESLLHRSEVSHTVLGTLEDSEVHKLVRDFATQRSYRSKTIQSVDHISVPEIAEAVQNSGGNRIILESSNTHEISAGSKDVKGRYSIIALDVDDGIRFEYRSANGWINAIYMGQEHHLQLLEMNIWEFLAQFLDKRKVVSGLEDSPFWGGFMGYTTYELGLQGIAVESKARKTQPCNRPDLSFVWVTRSLVVDHVKNMIYIQELAKDNTQPSSWLKSVAAKLQALSTPDTSFLSAFISASHHLLNISSNSSTASLSAHSAGTSSPPDSSRNSIDLPDPSKPHPSVVKSITPPSKSSYEAAVSTCQSYIRAGSSYELCYTAQTRVQALPTDPWPLYLTLRTRQPAPFASFIRLGSATLISSSPERFLTYSRMGKCELRPMKGTVRKSSEVSTLEQAKLLLDIPKEKAENLMIVDLVRHDLHGVCGSGNVQVPRLMVVEEYRSVFQMISVVEGQLPPSQPNGYTGLDVLAASLPPGSMTGAPKKRSCELLQGIEAEERSLFSGVVGYMDVGGRGDWSVTIRCMFRWDDESKDGMETWRIGAGGAVTVLSTPEEEREEMLTKLNGTLDVFK